MTLMPNMTVKEKCDIEKKIFIDRIICHWHENKIFIGALIWEKFERRV